jgi:hypothetical protein
MKISDIFDHFIYPNALPGKKNFLISVFEHSFGKYAKSDSYAFFN